MIEERLFDWCWHNNLCLNKESEKVFSIEGVEGKFLLIEPWLSEDNKKVVVLPSLQLVLQDAHVEILQSNEEVDKYLFEFGGCFYYSPVDHKDIDEDSAIFSPFDFNELRYLGNPRDDSSKQFVHLGVHDEYELLNGSDSAENWAKKASFLNMEALGLCDKNTLAGTLAFQLACKKHGVKSILGETVSVYYDDYDAVYEMKLYVLNKEGWQNLLRINTEINVHSSNQTIQNKKLISLGSGLAAVIPNKSFFTERKGIDEIVQSYENCFDLLFYQIDSVQYSSSREDLDFLEDLKYYYNNYLIKVPPILINDSYYINKDSFEIKKILNESNKTGVKQPLSKNQYFKTSFESQVEISKLSSNQELVDKLFYLSRENTTLLAQKSDWCIPTGEHKLPKFVYRGEQSKYKNIDNVELFHRLLEEGLLSKVDINDKKKFDVIMDRVEKEARVIVNAGFVDYFLILWDIIRFAKHEFVDPKTNKKGMLVGVGRGSVGGSLVAYLLDITDINPLEYDLIFERFLNETRVSGERAKSADALPDIDVDFEAENKDLVKAYVQRTYGEDQVCSIGTFMRFKLRQAMKDFFRVRGLSFKETNEYTSFIQNQIKYEWKDLFKYVFIESSRGNNKLKRFVKKYPKTFNLMKVVMNGAKAISIHPSAIVITPRYDEEGNRTTVFDWMPIKKIDGKLVSEWEGKYIDSAGFLKEDILGLSQLDKFKNMLNLIEDYRGEKIDLNKIPLDDEIVFDFFKQGLNEDVFQFGSIGLKKFSKYVKPDTLEDLIAMNALYRPGPMRSGAHHDFVAIKHGIQVPEYDYGLKEVTQKTFGLYIYQEQIMKAVHVLGNLTLSESDEVRTVMKKFDDKKMRTFEEKFKKGAIENGCEPSEANLIWDKLYQFSGYGFNRSHSAAYALLAYWSQWFKANYPLEFWATALQYCKEDYIFHRLNELVREKRVKLLPPDINKSESDFKIEPKGKGGKIYWGLSKIKGIGPATVSQIIQGRDEVFRFKSLEHFIQNVEKSKVNKKSIELLIVSGCFDEMYGVKDKIDRKLLLEYYASELGADVNRDYFVEESNEPLFWSLKQQELIGYSDVNYKELIRKYWKEQLSRYVETQDFIDSPPSRETLFCLAGTVAWIDKMQNKKGNKYYRLSFVTENRIISSYMFYAQLDVKENEETMAEIFELSQTKKMLMVGFLGTKGSFSNAGSPNETFFSIEKVKILR